MHPYVLQELASTRRTDLRASAQRSRRARVLAHRRRGSVRHLAGWTLIEIGIRLAGTPGNA